MISRCADSSGDKYRLFQTQFGFSLCHLLRLVRLQCLSGIKLRTNTLWGGFVCINLTNNETNFDSGPPGRVSFTRQDMSSNQSMLHLTFTFTTRIKSCFISPLFLTVNCYQLEVSNSLTLTNVWGFQTCGLSQDISKTFVITETCWVKLPLSS